ncbi:MAG: energy transducer TonB [Cytophagales bacterium]|nr:energy transducer TonB [Cytophagales bacterium]
MLPLTDIVFEYKNRAYGAYILRKSYIINHFKAFLWALLAFFVIILILWLASNFNKSDEKEYQLIDYKSDLFTKDKFKIPKILPSKAMHEDIEKKKENVKTNLPPVVQDDAKVQKDTTNNTSKADTSKSEEKGANNNLRSYSSDTVGTEMYDEEIFMKVDQNAQFPGGTLQLIKFLSERIVYPEYALKNKVSGLIYIHLVVNANGTLGDIKLYKGIEQTCNDEVLRVIRLMPDWIPARIKNKNVRQRVILPVKFSVLP